MDKSQTLKQSYMNTNEELTPKEQPTEQPTSEKQESNEPPKKKRVHGPMQLRVFQMMGMRLDVKKKDADSES